MRAVFVRLLLGGFAAWVLTIGLAAGQGNPEAAKLKNPVASTPESIAAGQATYQRYCRGCHGKDATGGPPKAADEVAAPNLIDDQWKHGGSDGEIYHVIK